jgi:hypothetical protein
MALEFWILLGLVAAGLLVGAVARLRRRRTALPAEVDRNVYPLW